MSVSVNDSECSSSVLVARYWGLGWRTATHYKRLQTCGLPLKQLKSWWNVSVEFLLFLSRRTCTTFLSNFLVLQMSLTNELMSLYMSFLYYAVFLLLYSKHQKLINRYTDFLYLISIKTIIVELYLFFFSPKFFDQIVRAVKCVQLLLMPTAHPRFTLQQKQYVIFSFSLIV